jgi:hypothetical protein
VPDTTTARTAGHDDLTGWYRMSTTPATAAAQADRLIEHWGAPARWPSIDGILADAERSAA